MLLFTTTASNDSTNYINLLQLKSSGLKKIAALACQFPVTGLESRMIYSSTDSIPILLTVSDALRVYCLQKINSVYQFQETKKIIGNGRPSPITSMSWSTKNQQLVAYSTFDKLIQMQDIETNKQLWSAQLHDSQSNSVQFDVQNENILFSGSTDGTLVEYDTRTQYNIQLYQNQNPILKIRQNPQDPNIIAFISQNSKDISLIDRRQNDKILQLQRHQEQVTSIDWNPVNSNFLVSTGADQYCYIFDITKHKAVLEYKAGDKCQSCQWGTNELSDWISIVWGNQVEILKVGNV